MSSSCLFSQQNTDSLNNIHFMNNSSILKIYKKVNIKLIFTILHSVKLSKFLVLFWQN